VRLLVLGNAPWVGSGYGEQIALLVPRLKAMGHEVAVAANYGLQGTIAPWNDVVVYPAHGDSGNVSVGFYAEHFEADMVLCLHDSWVMKPDAWPKELRMAMWAPVDHYPIPPLVLATLKHEKVRPIAMSKFGLEWMQKFKLDPLYAPHAVDTKLFRPQPEIRDTLRDEMGIPRDAFLVGMVAANRGWNAQVSRKAFPQALEAFLHFAERHDDAWLYMHTEGIPRGNGTNLETLILALDAIHERHGRFLNRVRFPSDKEMLMGLPREFMAAQYAAFDALLNPSMSEGFGVPLIEAQACGVPVIVSNHSSMPELCGAGWIVEGEPFWDALQDSFAFMPRIESIEAALESAYEAKGDSYVQETAVEFAQQYDIEEVAQEFWVPIMDELAAPRELPPLNGKARKRERKREAAIRKAAA